MGTVLASSTSHTPGRDTSVVVQLLILADCSETDADEAAAVPQRANLRFPRPSGYNLDEKSMHTFRSLTMQRLVVGRVSFG